MNITPKKYQSFRCRIKLGTLCGQDFRVFRWPDAGGKKPVDPDLVFELEAVNATIFRCSAPGFGVIGSYGNGPLYIHSEPKT